MPKSQKLYVVLCNDPDYLKNHDQFEEESMNLAIKFLPNDDEISDELWEKIYKILLNKKWYLPSLDCWENSNDVYDDVFVHSINDVFYFVEKKEIKGLNFPFKYQLIEVA